MINQTNDAKSGNGSGKPLNYRQAKGNSEIVRGVVYDYNFSRRENSGRVSYNDIAEKYGICPSTAKRIVYETRKGNLDSGINVVYKGRVSDEEVKQMVDNVTYGKSIYGTAKALGRSRSTVKRCLDQCVDWGKAVELKERAKMAGEIYSAVSSELDKRDAVRKAESSAMLAAELKEIADKPEESPIYNSKEPSDSAKAGKSSWLARHLPKLTAAAAGLFVAAGLAYGYATPNAMTKIKPATSHARYSNLETIVKFDGLTLRNEEDSKLVPIVINHDETEFSDIAAASYEKPKLNLGEAPVGAYGIRGNQESGEIVETGDRTPTYDEAVKGKTSAGKPEGTESPKQEKLAEKELVDQLLEDVSNGYAKIAPRPYQAEQDRGFVDTLNKIPVIGLLIPDKERVYTPEEKRVHPVATFYNQDLKDDRLALHPVRQVIRAPFRGGKVLLSDKVGKIPVLGILGKVIGYPFGIADELVGGTAEQIPIIGRDANELIIHPINTVTEKPWQALNTVATDGLLIYGGLHNPFKGKVTKHHHGIKKVIDHGNHDTGTIPIDPVEG